MDLAVLQNLQRKRFKKGDRNSGQSEDASVPFQEMDYLEFLKTKIEIATESGFEVEKSNINKALKDHQRDAVAWALKGGR